MDYTVIYMKNSHSLQQRSPLCHLFCTGYLIKYKLIIWAVEGDKLHH